MDDDMAGSHDEESPLVAAGGVVGDIAASDDGAPNHAPAPPVGFTGAEPSAPGPSATGPTATGPTAIGRTPPERLMGRPARRVLCCVALMALTTDLAFGVRIDGIAGALGAVGGTAALMASGLLRSRSAWALCLAAAACGAGLAFTEDPLLVSIDVIAVAAAWIGAVAVASPGRFFAQPPGVYVTAAGAVVGGALAAPARVGSLGAAAVGSLETRGWRRAGSALGALLVVSPVLLLLWALLVWADAVFASLFRVPITADSAVGHLWWWIVGAAWATGLLTTVVRRRDGAVAAPEPRATRPERVVLAVALLGGMVGLYALFALSQVVVVVAGAAHVEDVTGLTYAEYARSGFFQLLTVAGLTILLLLGVRATLGGAERVRAVAWLSVVACGLTLAIVAVAIRRLGLYDDAFGATRLRFVSTFASWWIGAVFVVLAVLLRPARRGAPMPPRTWFTGVMVVLSVAGVLALNLRRPDATIAERNMARASDGAPLDIGYLAELSDDAVPVVVSHLDELSPGRRDDLVATMCWDDREVGAGLAANVSERRATRALASICD